MRIHECNVYCYNQPPDLLELMGKEDAEDGKWLPFAFSMELVDAVKMASDDDTKLTYNRTALFFNGGDTYIIDTPYKKFLNLWKDFIGMADEPGPNDLEL